MSHNLEHLVIILDDGTPFERIMKASKERIQGNEEQNAIQEICNAIGDRRLRDLIDLLSSTETTSGWNNAVGYLSKASKMNYPIPVGFDAARTPLEPLKFREVLFDLFGCAGLEPIEEGTEGLLGYISEAESFREAESMFKSRAESKTLENLNSGNSLFFEANLLHSSLSDQIRSRIENTHMDRIKELKIDSSNNQFSILPLWYSEYGRLALSELGFAKTHILPHEFDTVLSVLQVSKELRSKLKISLDKKSDKSFVPVEPSNPYYRDLLGSIISMDIETMQFLGSRHACPTLNFKLREYVDTYKEKGDSKEYRGLLQLLRCHVKIRWMDSIVVISDLIEVSDSRITVDAIRSLGNFYHASATSTLLDAFCRTTDRKVRKMILNTIHHLRTRCPEVKGVVLERLDMNCRNPNELRRFYERTWK